MAFDQKQGHGPYNRGNTVSSDRLGLENSICIQNLDTKSRNPRQMVRLGKGAWETSPVPDL